MRRRSKCLALRQGAFSDIYAIGAVCYRAIGGTVVDAQARQIALTAGRPDPQPSAAEIGAGRYPGPLLAAIDAALTIDATKRPQSVEAMLESWRGRSARMSRPWTRRSWRRVARCRPPRRSLRPQPQRSCGGAAFWGWRGGSARWCWLRRRISCCEARHAARRSTGCRYQHAGIRIIAAGRDTAKAGTCRSVDGRRRGATGDRGRRARRIAAPTAPAHRGAAGGIAATRGDHGASTRAAAFANDACANYAVDHRRRRSNDAFANDAGTNAATEDAPPSSTRPGVAGGAAATPGDGSAGTTTRAATGSVSTSDRARPCITITGRAAATPGDGRSRTGTLTDVSAVAARTRAGGGRSLPCSILHVAKGPGRRCVSRASRRLDRNLIGCWPSCAAWVALPTTSRGSIALPAGRMAAVGTPGPTDLGCFAAAVRHSARSARGGKRRAARDRCRHGAARTVRRSLPKRRIGASRAAPGPIGRTKVGQTRPHAEWIAAPPPGPRLVVAIGSATPLDLGARPDTERAAEYLAVLQTGLQRAAACNVRRRCNGDGARRRTGESRAGWRKCRRRGRRTCGRIDVPISSAVLN